MPLRMDDQALELRYAAACTLVREGGALARRYFDNLSNLQVKFKGPQNYLTEADQAVERLITGRLRALFPEDTVFGEEDGGEIGEHAWVIDPIDGTENFARGIPHWCVVLAFVVGGAVELGVIYNPVSGELFSARQGHGAFRDGLPMRISAVSEMGRANIEVGWCPRRSAADYAGLVRAVLETGATVRRVGSGALGLAFVADGRIEGYAEHHINAWDCLAGILMIREAGGWVNDFLAHDGLRKGNELLAIVPALRDGLIAATGIGR